jgi:hypothetical protein
MECGGGGGGLRAGLVRRFLEMLFFQGAPKCFRRHEVSQEAGDTHGTEYNLAFEEGEAAEALSCERSEMHTMLARLAFKAKGKVKLFSSFPTKLKMRFFKTDVAELTKQDAFLRKVLPLAKCREGVYTMETAHAISQLGGEPGHLCSSLWQAQGEEFTVQKADFGYMLAVLKPVDNAQVEAWAEEISGINRDARMSDIGKLDAVYLALDRAAKLRSQSSTHKEGNVEASTPVSVDQTLNELIDKYFAVDVSCDPSAVVIESAEARESTLRQALGGDIGLAASVGVAGVFSRPSGSSAAAHGQGSRPTSSLKAASVHQDVARLLMGSDWPKVGTDDPDSIAHAAAQFLAGISSDILPARKWKAHTCWGKFRDFGDFDFLEDLVRESVRKLRDAQSARAGQAANALRPPATPATASQALVSA